MQLLSKFLSVNTLESLTLEFNIEKPRQGNEIIDLIKRQSNLKSLTVSFDLIIESDFLPSDVQLPIRKLKLTARHFRLYFMNKVSKFINTCKSTLEEVHLERIFEIDAFNTLLNKSNNLKCLGLKFYPDCDVPNAFSVLHENSSIETLFITSLADYAPIQQQFFDKFKNVKNLCIRHNLLDRRNFRSISQMPQLHSIRFPETFDFPNTMFNLRYSQVQNLMLGNTLASDYKWKKLVQSFPNIEYLELAYSEDEKYDFLRIIADGWKKSLKRVEIVQGLKASVLSLIYLMKNCKSLETLIIPKDAVFYFNLATMEKDRKNLTNLIEHGHRIFTTKLDTKILERGKNGNWLNFNMKPIHESHYVEIKKF